MGENVNEFALGDMVKWKEDGNWIMGTIINIYVVPKDYNLVDIELGEGSLLSGVIYGIPTDELTRVTDGD